MRRTRSVYRAGGGYALPLIVDLLLVVVFAVIGRMSHAEGLSLAGIVTTGWPFVLGLLLAWVLVTLFRWKPWRPFPAGVFVWIVTVGGGMLLRLMIGDTAEVPFIIVASIVLGAFLLLPRLLLGTGRDARSTNEARAAVR
ncbi:MULTISPECIES: DUF3054 domain-containing protein [unclassified Pseudoclavibacter]|uniref:DUF3054 domain-containing protein n=1 Tax=unclassified Pseudoclavibacter TaxID=2615177 RepID=UPI001BA879B4|nr:DUF3054 domain-containing protein [Pseudoclavibacter sp. Marseille-Q4354]MBS3177162.1 DUF3054 domain-containing protein [Pseudoclavibacter sp. Marseille-Q4354]